MIEPITLAIAVIFLVALIASGVYATNRWIVPRVKERFPVAPKLLPAEFEILAVGGFSAGQKTHLSVMAIPGGIRSFSAKAAASVEVEAGLRKRRQWVRHGEIRPAYISMPRF